jgi:predicted nucleic acid-binding protein
MSGVLLDTDVLIDHIRGRKRVQVHGASVSVVTRAELFAGREREEPAVEALLGRLAEIDVTPDIARRAGRIRRSTGLDVPDAIIAATALKLDMTVMTRNRRHFERVSGLTLRAPDEQTTTQPAVERPAD